MNKNELFKKFMVLSDNERSNILIRMFGYLEYRQNQSQEIVVEELFNFIDSKVEEGKLKKEEATAATVAPILKLNGKSISNEFKLKPRQPSQTYRISDTFVTNDT